MSATADPSLPADEEAVARATIEPDPRDDGTAKHGAPIHTAGSRGV